MAYTRKRVEEITGIPARRIQFYTDNGLVELENPNPGRGRERQYSKKDILKLLIIGELAKNRVELSRIKKIVVDEPQKQGERAQSIFDPSFYEFERLFTTYIIIYEDEIEYRGRLPAEHAAVKVGLITDKDRFSRLLSHLNEDERPQFEKMRSDFAKLPGKIQKRYEELLRSLIIREDRASVIIINVTLLAKKLKEL